MINNKLGFTGTVQEVVNSIRLASTSSHAERDLDSAADREMTDASANSRQPIQDLQSGIHGFFTEVNMSSQNSAEGYSTQEDDIEQDPMEEDTAKFSEERDHIEEDTISKKPIEEGITQERAIRKDTTRGEIGEITEKDMMEDSKTDDESLPSTQSPMWPDSSNMAGGPDDESLPPTQKQIWPESSKMAGSDHRSRSIDDAVKDHVNSYLEQALPRYIEDGLPKCLDQALSKHLDGITLRVSQHLLSPELNDLDLYAPASSKVPLPPIVETLLPHITALFQQQLQKGMQRTA
ncbi:hypothetical protein OPT61_g3083 [Boeremia exigua]|uniref:Uncharacterized protein n=1 Tax=Boeremia exigua TaxID=749465 RepID=A0ACC2IJ69_9PLEO|nr:hypothetical protein OPT61_g3083 [Boeremia exigua]